MKIILIGFMASGKSSVAQKLGRMLDRPVIEMDDLVLQKTNSQNMHEVFAKGGELLLRETETEIAQAMASIDKAVISTGGGVVLNRINFDYLKQNGGSVFWLNAPFQTLAMRLASDTTRPLWKNIVEAEFHYRFRQSLYDKFADYIVDVGNKSVEEIAQEITDKSYGK